MRSLLLAILFAMPSFAAWIHPDMQAAIEKNESSVEGLKAGDDSEYIWIGNEKFFTGYKPTRIQYEGALFQHFRRAAGPIPKSFDYRKFSFSPVRGQQAGDCWAQGNVSAWEMTVNAVDRLKHIFAVQDVIDCSNFGTARSGGQLSMKYDLGGLAFEKDYPYQGRDTTCKRSVVRNEKAVEVGYLRGADGKFPTLEDIQVALLETGAMEVCGSASSLGGGGRQDSVRNGSVNHCYALVGWLDGKEMGWLDETYLIIKNSWGDGSGSELANGRSWGDKGYGYYPLAKEDGVHLRGSVITELQWAKYKPIRPPGPTAYAFDTDRASVTGILGAGASYSAQEFQDALTKNLKKVNQ